MKKPPVKNLKEAAAGRHDIYEIPIRDIEIDPGFNVRKDMGDLRELGMDINANGMRLPLEVRIVGGRVSLVDGHRRLKAAQIFTALKTVPCTPEARNSGDVDRLFSMLSRNTGKPLDPMEEAEAFRRILGLGCRIKDIATRTGKAVKTVRARLNLLGAIPELKEALKKGRIKPGAAAELAGKSESKQSQVLSKAGRGKVSPAAVAAVDGKIVALGLRALKKETQRWASWELAKTESKLRDEVFDHDLARNRVEAFTLGLRRARGETVTEVMILGINLV